MLKCVALLLAVSFSACLADEITPFPPGWTAQSPREEIRPKFWFEPQGGPQHAGSFVIQHDQREGLDGWLQKSFPVTGGDYFCFHAVRKLDQVVSPRRSALVRILWQNDEGKMVDADVSKQQVKELGHTPTAEPEHPQDGSVGLNGWSTVSGTYRVPAKATRAIVELHLQWAPGGRVEWSDIEFVKTTQPPTRTVRLATIHYKPTGATAQENCEQYASLIEKASLEKADLVVLGETVPTASPNMQGLEIHKSAESIPGPSTDYFGQQAKQHGLHIVLSLYERDQHLIYNTAVLLGPEGQLIGKYRKVCLPHGEVEKGIAPGNDFPVFNTAFGKVGMMVCYDGFFPEVARELSLRGAEVIAWPVWGCNPQLAKARACENHVYIVSSTFMEPKDQWMVSAVFDQTGKPLVHADHWGSVAVAEVELSNPYIGPWNLGDFKSMINRHRPVAVAEPRTPANVDGGRSNAEPSVNSQLFIDTGFENASPVWWDYADDGVVNVQLLYDHERDSTNRAAGHIHFAVESKSGSKHTLEFKNLNNIYNGRHGSVANELRALVISEDGKVWRSVPTRSLEGNRVQLDLKMTKDKMFVARVEPYRLSDLENWLASIKNNPSVDIERIGESIEGRPLEIVRVGEPSAPFHVFVRARAHAWESGGNWVAQGLVNRLLQNDEDALAFRKRYCLWVLPMANKDAVAKGRTRFNLSGIDLNRGWDQLADPVLAPENHALEIWLNKQIKSGRKPSLALELHNDGNGNLHPARASELDTLRTIDPISRLESLLRKHTWFTEGSTKPSGTTFTLADGFLQRFGIESAVHEFNCNWIEGLKEPALARHWEDYGGKLALVLHEYFGPTSN